MEWQSIKLPGQDALAVRASKKLRSEELLFTAFAPTRLRMELDRVPLWREDRDVSARQLIEDFARYIYLPRLRDATVLVGAIRDGLGLISWEQDSFAYADSYDPAVGRYRGLRAGESIALYGTEVPGMLVKPQVAKAQLAVEAAASSKVGAITSGEASPPERPKSTPSTGRPRRRQKLPISFARASMER